MSQNQHVAQTILSQLGGRLFIAMTGARNFVSTSNGLSFRIPGNITKQRINGIRITLNSLDTYDIIFFNIHGIKLNTRKEITGIYAEDLTEIFREVTGLETRMPRIIGINA